MKTKSTINMMGSVSFFNVIILLICVKIDKILGWLSMINKPTRLKCIITRSTERNLKPEHNQTVKLFDIRQTVSVKCFIHYDIAVHRNDDIEPKLEPINVSCIHKNNMCLYM